MINVFVVCAVVIISGVKYSFAVGTGQCPPCPPPTTVTLCDDYTSHINCLGGKSTNTDCTDPDKSKADSDKIKAETEMSNCKAGCNCRLALATTNNCSDLSTYLSCLEGVTPEKKCNDAEVKDAIANKDITKSKMSTMKCSGAPNLMTSLFPVILLSLLTRYVSGY